MADFEGRTQLFITRNFVVDYDYHCRCEFDCTCYGIDSAPGILNEVTVSVLQKPIVTKPTDTSFFIEIDRYQTTRSLQEKKLLTNESFTIAQAVADVDLDRSFNEQIKRYVTQQQGREIIRQEKFSAPSAKDKYIAAFYLLVNRVLNKVPERQQSDNPHFAQRKKKY